MKTEPLAPVRASRSPGTALPRDRRWAGAAAALAIVAIAVPFFVATYAVHSFDAPLGWDTPKYVWKTTLAADLGITTGPDRLPPPVNASPDRPAFPVVALTLSKLVGASPWLVAAALPAAAAACIGLAAAALCSLGLRRRPWESALIGASVATSVVVARLGAPEAYQDNLLAGAVVLAGAALCAGALDRRRGLVAPILLLGATALVHWTFALLFAGLLVAAALWFLPESWRAWRGGERPLSTPAGSLGAIAGGGAALGAAALFGLLGAGPRRPKTSPQAESEYTKKLRQDLPLYRLWFMVPAAAIGALGLGRSTAAVRAPETPAGRGRPLDQRFSIVLLTGWLVAVTAALLLSWAGVPVAAHRFLAFALPLPILVALGGLAVGAWVAPRSRVVATVAVVGVLGFAAYVGQAFWLSNRPQVNAAVEREAANAAAYLEAARVHAGRPVVFIVNGTANPGVDTAFFAHQVRAALPAERIPDAYFYLGDPDVFLAARPTIVRPVASHRDFDGTSWRYFRAVRPLAPPRPVALLLPSLNPDREAFLRWTSAHPGRLAAPGVFVVRGPVPGNPLPAAAPPVGHVSAPAAAGVALAAVALFLLVGSGWSAAAARGWSLLTSAGVAAGAGIAALVATAVLLDRLGIRPGGAGALLGPALAAGAGWAVFGLRGRRSEPSR